MTTQNLFERLFLIGQEILRLLKDTGFDLYDGLWENVRPLPDPCEDAFLRGKAEELIRQLWEVSDELDYLKKPTHGKHTLTQMPGGRYGYLDEGGTVCTFTCGERLEALIRDRFGNSSWAASRMEHDGDDYYLVGFHEIPLAGLTVRERW